MDCAQQDMAGLQLGAEDMFQLEPPESPAVDETKEVEAEDILPEELAYHCNGIKEEETEASLDKVLPRMNDKGEEIEVSLGKEVTGAKSN